MCMEYKSNKKVKRMDKMHSTFYIHYLNGMSFYWLVLRNASENFNL